MSYQQIKVNRLHNTNNDLFVVNVARVSFGAWHKEFHESDKKLINYLADHQHTSPFRHVRETFDFNTSISHVIDMKTLTSFERAGLVNDRTRVRHSLFGWFNLLKNDRINEYYALSIIKHLVDKYPNCSKAFGFVPVTVNVPTCDFYRGIEINPEFIDKSYRITAPITLARQAVKHQVNLSWNEISRRYVDSDMEFFKQEFRLRPDGNIKQGSGEVTAYIPAVLVGNHALNIHAVVDALADWYEQAVDPDIYNIAPETARGYLPLNMMTTWIWTGNLTAWDHFIALRDDSHAQLEIQDLARKIKDA